MNKDSKHLLKKHEALTQSDNVKVLSHVQREEGDWIKHTLMIESADVPFVFRRKQHYKSLTGARVNLTYYPSQQDVAGIPFEFMKVVRLRRS